MPSSASWQARSSSATSPTAPFTQTTTTTTTPRQCSRSHLPDPSHLRPDEYAPARDALRAIHAMIPETDRELYDIMLAVREPGTLARIHSYADRHGIGQSGVYARIEKLARAIQRHPWFDEITSPFRPLRRAGVAAGHTHARHKEVPGEKFFAADAVSRHQPRSHSGCWRFASPNPALDRTPTHASTQETIE